MYLYVCIHAGLSMSESTYVHVHDDIHCMCKCMYACTHVLKRRWRACLKPLDSSYIHGYDDTHLLILIFIFIHIHQ
jgi:hypothetical protein